MKERRQTYKPMKKLMRLRLSIIFSNNGGFISKQCDCDYNNTIYDNLCYYCKKKYNTYYDIKERSDFYKKNKKTIYYNNGFKMF
jgi:hypothetical protein